MHSVTPLRYGAITLAVRLAPLFASAGQTWYAGPGALGNLAPNEFVRSSQAALAESE